MRKMEKNIDKYNYQVILSLLLFIGPFVVLISWLYWGGEVSNIFRLVSPSWDYVCAIFVGLFFILAIPFYPVSAKDKPHLFIIWLAKLVFVLGMMLLYESNYPADAVGYYHRGIAQDINFSELTFGRGTQLITSITILIDGIVPESYHTMKVFASLIGFMAIYIFYRAACIYLQSDNIKLLYILALFPSIFLWSSILNKDPFTLFGIAVYALGVVGYYQKREITYVVLIVVGILIASAIRIWLGAIFVLPLSVFFLKGNYKFYQKAVFVAFVVIVFTVMFGFISTRFGIQSTSDIVSTLDYVSQTWDRGGSGQHIEGGFNSLGDLITFAPVGAFTALFRPLPGEVMNPFGFLAGLENLFILSMVLFALFRGNWRRLSHPLMLWMFATIVIWAGIYGFVSYQNLGTASRFRLQIMPFLLLLLLHLNSNQFRISRK